jgi:ATP-dependent DNA helicase DinG
VSADRVAPDVRATIQREVAAAGGREVSFVAGVDGDGVLTTIRPVARGTVTSVLALPGVAMRGEMLVHNHPSGILEPSQADLSVAARLHDDGIGFAIVDNEASGIYVVVEVPRAPKYTLLDAVAVAADLGRDSPVADALGGFEDRPSQRDMAAYVADVFNDGGVSLLEAGTGVGKSFAYLVPALEWAYVNRERTVVSTNTINLQEQLVGKDLPLLHRAYRDRDRPPTFALLKGWRNYLCIARLNLARSQGVLLEPERAGELDQLADWAARTGDGSLADLVEQPTSEVWDEVSAEPDLCTRTECPYWDRCFLFKARRTAADADVVVVNHHLLSADLAVRRTTDNWGEGAVLPPYRRLIIDEAHHLEDTAAQHLGHQVSTFGVNRLLGRLERNGRGLIPTLMSELARRDDSLSQASVELCRTEVLPTVQDARDRTQQVFSILAGLLTGRDNPVVRIDDSFDAHPVWNEGLGVALDNVVSVLRDLKGGVEIVADRLELDEATDNRSQLLKELRGVIRRLEGVVDGMLLTLRPRGGMPTVRWIERRGSRPMTGLPFPIGLSTVPLDLAQLLKESLFDRVDSVVLTSATLTTGGTFDFLKERLGLSIPPLRNKAEEVLSSPFNYREQCLLGIPTDLPDPRNDPNGHSLALTNAVMQLAHASDGGIFVLFTSYAALRRAANALRNQVSSRWPLLVQGEGQRDRLLQRFRESGTAILLGTDSFWEGVDVPGRALRALVIAKLPFKVPTEPMTAARLEQLAERGKDGFMHYLVPHAALRLKQGFGRLIRTRTDFGVVVLFDHRIISRNYGQIFLDSLPQPGQVVGNWEEVRQACEEFFAQNGVGAAAPRGALG